MMHPFLTGAGYREPLPSRSTRKVAMRSATSCRGYVTVWSESEQWWRRVVFESLLELMFIHLILARDDVLDIWEQPPAVPFVRENGKQAHHFFDFLITWTDGSSTAVAAKPFELVEKRRFDEEIALIAAQTPKSYADEVILFTDQGFQRHDAVNAARFHQFSATEDAAADTAVIEQIQSLEGAASIEQIVERTGLAGRAYRAVVRAIFRGDLRQVVPGLIDYPPIVKQGQLAC
jgi:hypothetical protein